jgi:antitoxin PrlF
MSDSYEYPSARSRVSVKSQTVIPRRVREALAIQPGDTLLYRFTDEGIVITRAQPEGDDPFVAFSEWGGKNDDDAYAEL